MRQWGGPGRMCCSGKEGSVDAGMAREVAGRGERAESAEAEEGPHCLFPRFLLYISILCSRPK